MSAETASPPTDSSRARKARLIGILALAAVVAGTAIATLHGGKASDAPEKVFDYVRDRTLAGDGDAMWREMTLPARQAYVKFLDVMDKPGGSQGTVFDPAEWRKKCGLSAEEVRRLPPEKVMARENLAVADELFLGSRVFKVDRLDGETAFLQITLRSGHDRFWVVRHIDGAWKIDDLWGTMGPDGRLIPRPGGSAPGPREAGNRPPR
jgi:hypothetical protein